MSTIPTSKLLRWNGPIDSSPKSGAVRGRHVLHFWCHLSLPVAVWQATVAITTTLKPLLFIWTQGQYATVCFRIYLHACEFKIFDSTGW